MFGHLPVTSPHAIRTGSWLARVALTSAILLRFLQRGLQAGIRNFKSKGGVKFAATAAAIAVSLSLAPMPADGSRHVHPKSLPYPPLDFPFVITGSQYAPMAWGDIPGWNDDDHLAAFKAFRTSCKVISAQTSPPGDKGLSGSLREPCREARAVDISDSAKAKAFFEKQFDPLQISRLGEDQGFVTGYYEPVIDGSRTKTDVYTV